LDALVANYISKACQVSINVIRGNLGPVPVNDLLTRMRVRLALHWSHLLE